MKNLTTHELIRQMTQLTESKTVCYEGRQVCLTPLRRETMTKAQAEKLAHCPLRNGDSVIFDRAIYDVVGKVVVYRGERKDVQSTIPLPRQRSCE